MLTIGDKFPSFSLLANTSPSADDPFITIDENTYAGKWKVYFFWPKDFTFVCPTEIVGYGQLKRDFEDRDCVLIGGSTDNEFVHRAWRNDHADLKPLRFPWLADTAHRLSSALGILEKDAGVCFRATFIVDPENVIRHVTVNDLGVGRNPAETLRLLDAFQTDELCPCNWKKGDDTLHVK
jgi:peroxiredoxin (alkyl hydroperoxide reductase subunit C)